MIRAFALVSLLLLALFRPVLAIAPEGTRVTLGNGMEALLLPDPTSRVVTSIVVVNSGSAWETERTSGASHFLEHMLFNGTERRSQQELYDEVDFLGGFNNAFTRRGETAFMVTMPSAHLGRALDVQSDMLLRSRIPRESFEKERGIILEEMAKDRDSESYGLERALEAETYPGCGWGLPVLGTEESIRSLDRDEVWRFYRANYVPERMRIVLVGGFAPEAAVDSLEKYFGTQRPAGSWPAPPPAPAPLVAPRVVRETLTGTSAHLRLVWNAAPPGDRAYLATRAAASIQLGDETSPLARAVGERLPGALAGWSGGIEPGYGFARLILDVTAAPGTSLDALRDAIERAMPALAPPDVAALRAWQVSERASLLYARQQSYMLAPVASGEIALFGTWGLQSLPERVGDLTPAEVDAAARTLGSGPSLAVLLEPAAAEQSASIAPETAPYSVADTTLAGGARLLALQGPSNGVLAIYVLFEGRNYIEPADRGGVTELLHSLWTTGTPRRDEAALTTALGAIGAQVQCADNPDIPFDDRYTQPDFSFIRFQALEEHAPEAFALLGEILSGPRFDPAAIERVRGAMLARDVRQSGQSSFRARSRLAAILYGADAPAARSPYGDSASVAAITLADLRAQRERLRDPRRMWVAVSSPLPAPETVRRVSAMLEAAGLQSTPGTGYGFDREAMRELRAHLGSDAARRFAAAWAEAPRDTALGTRRLELKGGGAQAFVMEAMLLSPTDSLPAPGSRDEAAGRIATGAISSRIAFQVRERLGLAYGIGASLAPVGDRWLYTAAAGTRPPGVPAVAAGFVQGRRSTPDAVDARGLEREANALYGAALRRQESRINQAMEAVLAVRDGKGSLDWWRDAERFRGMDRGIVAGALRQVARADTSIVIVAR